MPVKNLCTEASLSELMEIVHEAERSDPAAIQLVTQPRTFLIERGYCLPVNAKSYITPTEELQARLQTKNGVNEFVDREQEVQRKIKIHVKTGVARCVRIEFE
jgi:hypothetical protein